MRFRDAVPDSVALLIDLVTDSLINDAQTSLLGHTLDRDRQTTEKARVQARVHLMKM